MTSDEYTISVTFDTVTPESAEQGAVAGSGFTLEPTPIDSDDIAAYLENGAEGLLHSALGFAHAHSGYERGNDASFYAADPVHDDIYFRHGEETRYAIHLNGNWPEKLAQDIADFLTA